MYDGILVFKLSSGQQTREQICAKIASLDEIIDMLYTTALTSVSNGHMIEYQLDTGQTKQRVQYSTTESVTRAIEMYEMLRQRLQNKLNSRTFRLMDSKNFRGIQ